MRYSRLGWTLVLALAGCGGEGETTTGARFALATRMTAEAGAVTTRSGWSVTLDKAQIAVGALHYFTGEPLGASYRVRPARGLLATLWQLGDERLAWQVPSAWAHPGHYVEGDALGEMLEPTSVDLLAGVTDLAPADATSGSYRSARFTFGSPPAGPLAAQLGDASLVLEGVASKDGESRRFVFRATAAQLVNASGNSELEGCHFAEQTIESTGTVTVTARPSIWFAAADFGELALDPSGGAVEIAAESKLYRQIHEQVLAAAGIDFSYAAQ